MTDNYDFSSVNPKVEVGTALVLEETDMVECEGKFKSIFFFLL